MLGRFLALLRGKGLIIRGTSKLPEGQARKVDIGDVLAGGTQVILSRVGGKLYALDALCPHEGGRIAPGPLLEGTQVMCPLHNYKFDARTGVNLERACGAAKRYRVRESGDDCEIWV
jgi:nitrite reductase/ring-hydroxylating ferredoxin subunit